ncbi:MAG: radical SAM protein [Pseudomonadota bacterium]
MTVLLEARARAPEWLETPAGEARGYIKGETLKELWIHTGTACNLACPFCLEGSKPGDMRLGQVTLADAKPLIDEAYTMGTRQFSFTGGEPFTVKEFVEILRYAAGKGQCLVLTNGTLPVLRRIKEIASLVPLKDKISFRISIDYPDAARHDEGRGEGSFDQALEGMRALYDLGFSVSLARQMEKDEADKVIADAPFRELLKARGLPHDLTIIAFPDFATPGSILNVPHISEDCMTRYHTEASRAEFMCGFSRMAVKDAGEMRVYACTLVDDDPDYDLGPSLKDSMDETIRLKHHRCYSCFAYGASCSESGA